MSFLSKICLAILFVSVSLIICVTIAFYQLVNLEWNSSFVEQYNSLGISIANSFQQLEKFTSRVNYSAALALKSRIDNGNIPSNRQLAQMAKEYGVTDFSIINKKGQFIRDGSVPLSKTPSSIFNFCPSYKNLVLGDLNYVGTPIMPDYTLMTRSNKWLMIPNKTRDYIIEVETTLSFIEEILEKTIAKNKNIVSVGLYSPNGYSLGYIGKNGKFKTGENLSKTKLVNEEYKTFTFKIMSDVKKCCECKFKNVQTPDGKDYYYILKISVSKMALHTALYNLRLKLILMVFISILISYFLSRMLAKSLVSKLTNINKSIDKMTSSGNLKIKVANSTNKDEVNRLAQTIDKMVDKINRDQDKIISQEKERSIAKLAGNVAHDIQSPLTALKTLLQSIDILPENQRVLFRRATERIIDIANSLLAYYRGSSTELNKVNNIRPEILFCLLDEIISEKRIEYKKRGIKFILTTDGKSFASFSCVNLYEFKRVISNLVNNSIEAIDKRDSRKVTIAVSSTPEIITIKIIDTGCGIDKKIVDNLMFLNVESKKHEGKGMGLSLAQQYISSWKGSLKIKSTPDVGTTINICLPISPWPLWFSGNIIISPDIKVIVILDDDPSIHSVWEERFKNSDQALQLKHFTKSSDFKAWMINCNANQSLFLIDYELIDEEYTGLEIVESTHLTKNCYLVTSRYEESEIRNSCVKKHIRIIPKYYANYTQILYIKNIPIILIDDENTVHTTWEFAAELSGVNLKLYKTPDEFLKDCTNISKEAIIYLDSNLADNIKGEDFAGDIFNAGFHSIYLATGKDGSAFIHTPFIKGVCNKEPPF